MNLAFQMSLRRLASAFCLAALPLFSMAAKPASADQPQPAASDLAPRQASPTAASSAVRLLREFKETDVKFDLAELMDMLRDRRHEGWVLAAYPDPKTSRPLIGAGVSLDLPARDHPQRDPLNPHPFLEPSSADLWQASGLDPARLDAMLSRYNDRMASWGKRRFRQKIRTLEPEISDPEAELLLRTAVIQAIYNAKAYCRNFDQLTASQQMALSQLVYQMGVNLEGFGLFLGLVNDGLAPGASVASLEGPAGSPAYWHSVQQALMQSQWARLYRTRAVSVIAMLDPAYAESPAAAEGRISAALRPAVVHRRRGRKAVLREVATSDSPRSTSHKKHPRARSKRRA